MFRATASRTSAVVGLSRGLVPHAVRLEAKNQGEARPKDVRTVAKTHLAIGVTAIGGNNPVHRTISFTKSLVPHRYAFRR